MQTLFSPYPLGTLLLPNRAVMAPMTRNRALGHVPNPWLAQYYEQRSAAGLIVTEATQVAPESIGYPDTPGIHDEAQVAGWAAVTRAVHASGGRIFLQLWHVGRIAHPAFPGAVPLAPSAVAAAGTSYTPQGPQPFAVPRELDEAGIARIVEAYRVGARNARAAGFDGVEIHGANGYLIDQFLRDGSNRRTDAWGGSAAKRARFLLEVASAVAGEWPDRRVGVRLSPSGTFNDMRDSDPLATFGHALRELARLPLAYVHLVEGTAKDEQHGGVRVPTERLRASYPGTLVVNGGYDAQRAEAVLASGAADLVSFGVPYLANPDLLERFRQGADLNPPDTRTFYGGGERGYIDYPTWADVQARMRPPGEPEPPRKAPRSGSGVA
jgi:N-ethylmaleimide reductase